ncbi:DUF6482 family protein [Microbulbifer agarilyticus]|uniref:NADH-quinone reductase n=1 Tax=Microbulbifer agarilyticus TaxID=260552 RepID=A0A1Q2M0X0_9GAMM|nr:DUF6482 family protein [Microbulbifer agarilyticus]AQQ66354.1 hypothetical protein Mag101_00840 [Microbulbifer agarilyticus]MBY6190688.1 hypothetical protein [Microbulbifer agarilyticus]MBY6211293.1 hypothetical protein [Microbulbifer agarilyticus]MCA0894952.1 DUF6482 family protein [Microbulbifer agarilyticus]
MNLQIISLEGQTYLVNTIDENGVHPLEDRNKRPMQFHCLEEIKDYLNPRAYDEVWLEQRTPYEEMCGLGDDTGPLRVQLHWS